MYFSELGFKSYNTFLESPYWRRVCDIYRRSSLLRQCWVCDERQYQLHHEDYSILGKELEKGNLKKLVPLCDKHHHLVHFDETGDKIPLKPWCLRERREALRKAYIKSIWWRPWLWKSFTKTYVARKIDLLLVDFG